LKYRITFSKDALKEYGKLSQSRRRLIERKIDGLAMNPRPSGCKKLAGNDGLYRIRSGDYRVLYRVTDKTLVILVVKIGHRRDIYN